MFMIYDCIQAGIHTGSKPRAGSSSILSMTFPMHTRGIPSSLFMLDVLPCVDKFAMSSLKPTSDTADALHCRGCTGVFTVSRVEIRSAQASSRT